MSVVDLGQYRGANNADVPGFHNNGVLYSVVPRARDLEQQTSPTNDDSESIMQYLSMNGASGQMYVVRVNRTGVRPTDDTRDPRAPFLANDRILGTLPLSDKEDAAQAYIIGAVTGPYAAQVGRNDEWHGMLMVTRGKEQVPTFGDLTTEELHSFQKIIGKTLDFMEFRGEGRGFVGFSFSPLESRRKMLIQIPGNGIEEVLFPRSPVQNLATIHGHAVMLNPKYLRKNPVSSLDRFDRRMIQEPNLENLVEIYRSLVYEPVSQEFPNLQFAYSEHTAGDDLFPKGVFITIQKEQLKQLEFARFVHRLHEQSQLIYSEIADTVIFERMLTEGIVKMRSFVEIVQRQEVLFARPEYKSLSQETQKFIRRFSRMRDPNMMMTPDMPLEERARIVESFVLLGLAYNAVYYYPDGYKNAVTYAVQPRWISGASSLETLGIFKDQIPVATDVFQAIMENHQQTGGTLVQELIDDQDNIQQ